MKIGFLNHKAGHVRDKWRAMAKTLTAGGHDVDLDSTGNCDVLFLWNGSSSGRILRNLPDTCTPVFAELGWLPQRRHLFFDLQGVGPLSTLRQWEFRDSLTPKQDAKLDSQLRQYFNAVGLGKHDLPDDLPPDFVLAPLQDARDSQIKKWAPESIRYRGMQEFIDVVAEMAGAENVVYKMHPKTKDEIDDYRWPAGSRTLTDRLPELLQSCASVITINSTVGMEAIAFNKPVTALGKAIYGGMCGNVDPQKRRAFLSEVFRRQWYDKELLTVRVLRIVERIANGENL